MVSVILLSSCQIMFSRYMAQLYYGAGMPFIQVFRNTRCTPYCLDGRDGFCSNKKNQLNDSWFFFQLLLLLHCMQSLQLPQFCRDQPGRSVSSKQWLC